MSDIDTMASLVAEIETLKHRLREMTRHHLQMMTVLTYGLGGELRFTEEDFRALPVGASLSVAKDSATGDTLFKVIVPVTEEHTA